MERKTVSALLVFLLLASATLFAVDSAYGQVGTQVSGTLTADATWTPQGSPYTLVGDNFTVAGGVTLTVLPGTVVDLKLTSFIIEGTLRAIGDDASRIVIQAEQRLTRSWRPEYTLPPAAHLGTKPMAPVASSTMRRFMCPPSNMKQSWEAPPKSQTT